jgi:hypothetical protein
VTSLTEGNVVQEEVTERTAIVELAPVRQLAPGGVGGSEDRLRYVAGLQDARQACRQSTRMSARSHDSFRISTDARMRDCIRAYSQVALCSVGQSRLR